jgi:hypothetical protein
MDHQTQIDRDCSIITEHRSLMTSPQDVPEEKPNLDFSSTRGVRAHTEDCAARVGEFEFVGHIETGKKV